MLQRAEILIRIPSAAPILRSHHFARCLYTAYWNLGGVARQQAAESTGDSTAIRFLRQSVTLTTEASTTFPVEEDRTPSKPSLHVKLEFLAGCLYGIGNKAEAYKTYVEAIQKYNLSRIATQEMSGELALTLTKTVHRLTKIAVSEILMPAASVSLATSLDQRLPPQVKAQILEMQISALQNSLYRPEAVQATSVLYEDLVLQYSELTDTSSHLEYALSFVI